MKPDALALAAQAPLAPVTVLVNSSDGFEDCWQPFFTLFQRYWPGCPWPVVLNTERKAYSNPDAHPGLRIHNSQVALGESRRLTWSECLMRCLEGIDTELVLYLQEDYFLEAPVDDARLRAFAALMSAGHADVVRVMECGGSGPWHPTAVPELWRVDDRARYRIALQAALWRKSTLQAQLRAHESPWQLEVFGSGRARRRRGERVLCVNRDHFHGPGREILPYTPTGVVKGQWEAFVPALFDREGIAVDFSHRGFYSRSAAPAPKAALLRRLADRARSFL